MNWTFFFLACGLLLWFIAFFRLKAYIRRRTDTDYIRQTLREEIRLLEADIDEKTEQSLMLLEEKIGELRRLCDTAEKRVSVYTRELDRRNGEAAAFAALAPQTAPDSPQSAARRGGASPAPAAPGRKTPRSGRKKKSPLLDSLEVREAPPAPAAASGAAGAYRAQMRRPARKPPPPKTPPQPGTPAQTAPPAAQTAPQPAQADTPAQAAPRFITSPHPVSPKPPPLRERVSELHRAGFSEDLIAVRLGISVTEARLYIAMGG